MTTTAPERPELPVPPGLERLGNEITGKQKLFREAQAALDEGVASGKLSAEARRQAIDDLKPKHEELLGMEREYKDWAERNAYEQLQIHAPSAAPDPYGPPGSLGGARQRQEDFVWDIWRSADGAQEYPIAPPDTGLTPGEMYVRSESFRNGQQWSRVMVPGLYEQVFRQQDIFREVFQLGTLANRLNETDRPVLPVVLPPIQPPIALDLMPIVPVAKTRFSWPFESVRRIGDDAAPNTRESQRQSMQVAEGGLRPESNFQFRLYDVVLTHVGHILPYTEEAEMSEAELIAIINSQMAMGVREILSEALIREDGSAANLIQGFPTASSGTVPRADLGNTEIATYNIDTAEKIVQAIGAASDHIMFTGRAAPSSCLIAPVPWASVRDARDEAGWVYVHPASSDPARIHGVPIVRSTEIPLTGTNGVPVATEVIGIVGAFSRWCFVATMGQVTLETGMMNDDFGKWQKHVRAGVWAQFVMQRSSAFRRIEVNTL